MDREKTLERLNGLRYNLKTYKNSWFENRERPCIVWKRYDLGMGWASHCSGDPGGFKQLGFKGYLDFYKLPMEKRNEFLKEGLKIFVNIFGEGRIKGKTEELDTKYEMIEKELEILAKKYNKFKRKTSYDKKKGNE